MMPCQISQKDMLVILDPSGPLSRLVRWKQGCSLRVLWVYFLPRNTYTTFKDKSEEWWTINSHQPEVPGEPFRETVVVSGS